MKKTNRLSSFASSHFLLIALFVVLAGISAVSGFAARSANLTAAYISNQRGEQVLAMSDFDNLAANFAGYARLYAFTGDVEFYGLWHDELAGDTLYSVLYIVERYYTTEERREFDQVLENFNLMREFDIRAFGYTAEGRFADAITLLYSDEYIDISITMQDAGLELAASVYLRTLAEAEEAQRRAAFFETSSLAANILLALTAIFGIIFMVLKHTKLLGTYAENTYRTQFILDSLPIGITIWDEDAKMVDCNAEVVNRVGLSSKEEYINNFYKYMPSFQPDGTPSQEKANVISREFFETGGEFEWAYGTGGDAVLLEASCFPMRYKGRRLLLVCTRDVSEIRRRVKLLAAVNKAAAILLAVEDRDGLEPALLQSLELLGSCLTADDVHLWKLDAHDEGAKFTLISKWRQGQEGAGEDTPGEQDTSDRILPMGLIPEWDNFVLNKTSFGGPIADMSEQMRGVLGADGMLKSVFYIPVSLGDELWGLLNLDYCQKEYTLSDEEIDITRSASLMIATAIYRVNQQTEKMKIELQGRWDIIHNSTPIGVNLMNSSFQVIDCNEVSYKKIFGYDSKEEYMADMYRTIPEFQPDGTVSMEKIASDLSMALAEGYYRSEWMILDRNGGPIPIDVSAVRLQVDNEDILAIYIQDLRSVKAAEDFTRKLLDSAPMFMEIYDIDGEMLDCNQRMVDIFGVSSRSELIERITEFSVPIQPCGKSPEEAHMEAIGAAAEIGRYRAEWAFLLPNGEELPVDSVWVHIVHQGRPMIIAYSHDLRPVKSAMRRVREAEMKLHEQEVDERVKLMFDAAPIMIEFWDKDCKILDCNKTTLNLYGASDVSEFRNYMDESYIPVNLSGDTGHWDTWISFLEEVFNNGFGRCQYSQKRSTGETIVFEVDGIRTTYNDEEAVVTYAKDVTEIKKLQAERQRAQIAEESNRAKTMFIANMSHEIRTPMNSILGFSELALDDEISGSTRGYLQKIVTNTKWLLGVINDVLDISKIESGNLELEEIPFDIAKMVDYCVSLFTEDAKAKGLLLKISTDTLKPLAGRSILGDPTKLSQILINILSNAVKFTKIGTVSLQTTAEEITGKDCKLKFTISDTGIGMTDEQAAKILEPFTQADASTTRKYGGTGLGLAITTRLIEAMGGELVVDSVNGVGSTFSFTLTFKRAEKGPAFSGSRFDEEASLEKPSFNGEEILVVDDNSMNLGVAYEHLKRVGLVSFTALNGAEAVALCKKRLERGEKPFDLIFMDVHMPVMDGKEAAAIIKGLNTGAPIVAMTAEALTTNRKDPYKEYGMTGHLSKPFTAQELWKCLLRYLPKKGESQ